MIRLMVLWVVLLRVVSVQSQAEIEVPPQIAQLGRGTATSLDWHPNGDLLAVGGSLGVWLYNDKLEDVAHFPEAGAVDGVVWSPNGKQLATSDDDSVTVWDVDLDLYNLEVNRTWANENEDSYWLLRLSWSPEGERLAVVRPNELWLLDVNTGEILLKIPDFGFAMAWSPDGTQIAGAVNLGEEIGEHIRVWDAATGKVIQTYMGVDPNLAWDSVAWNPDGSVLVGTTVLPGTLHVWNTETGVLLNEVDTLLADLAAFRDVWWLNDGQELAIKIDSVVAPGGGEIDLWSTEDWSSLNEGIWLDTTRSVAKHPDKNLWATLTYEGILMLWNLDSQQPLQTRAISSLPSMLLAWSSDSHSIASASFASESVNIWNVATSDPYQPQIAINIFRHWEFDDLRWNTDNDGVLGLLSAFQITAPGAYPIGGIVEWDAKTGESLGTVHETYGYVSHDSPESFLPYYTWSEDFSRVVTQMDGEPTTISTVGGVGGLFSPNEVVATLEIVERISKIVWSPDNTRLAIITSNDVVNGTSAWIYDANDGQLITQLQPSLSSNLYDVSWSRDSSMVALVGAHGLADANRTEHRLDVLAVDPVSKQASLMTSVAELDLRFYHAWHPKSHTIAIANSAGIGIYPIDSVTVGIDAIPIANIPNLIAFALAWSPDGKMLAGSANDGTIRIWDVSALSD
jgi:WD40 repeat protein